MIVRDLIRDAIWRPGAGYARHTPDVSVLLPTFRRGANGWFLKAAESVLAQTLANLELIVIDDASTDGTAAQIASLMARDDRVSCITHLTNVGLPAISIFEAFLKSRGRYVAFAFDDFLFRPTALAQLHAAAVQVDAPMLHGYATIAYPSGQGWCGRRGVDFETYERLRQTNPIPNAGVLLRRDVVDDVGWYDPHRQLVRLCDHDYWARIARRWVIEYAQVDVGTEHGPTLHDSLGNTHPWDRSAAFTFMRTDRNQRLTPSTFLDRDVDAPGPPASAAPRLLVVSDMTATIPLLFEGMYPGRQDRLLLRSAAGLPELDLEALATSSGVIFGHGLFRHPYVNMLLRACQVMGVPAYFLMDDNWFVVYDELGHPGWKVFAEPATVDAIRGLTGLIVTSDPLEAYARERRLNDRVLQLRPVLDPQLIPAGGNEPGASLKIAIPGGAHRFAHFREVIVPGLESLAAPRPIDLLMRTEEAPLVKGLGGRTTISRAAYSPSFAEFVLRWRRHASSVMLHPLGRTKNIDYKTDNAVLVSCLLGAVPIVGDERAYAGLGLDHGVVKVTTNTTRGWRDAIERVGDAAEWRTLWSRLDRHCRHHYTPDSNDRVLDGLLANCTGVDDVERRRRIDAASTLPWDTVTVQPRWKRTRRIWNALPPRIRQQIRPAIYAVAGRIFPSALLPPL